MGPKPPLLGHLSLPPPNLSHISSFPGDMCERLIRTYLCGVPAPGHGYIYFCSSARVDIQEYYHGAYCESVPVKRICQARVTDKVKVFNGWCGQSHCKRVQGTYAYPSHRAKEIHGLAKMPVLSLRHSLSRLLTTLVVLLIGMIHPWR